ncbi:MAG: RluA family pseudouridine synthase [Ruminococcus sp.]|nr:RluA family pseudouridine synthase [Ruminococcus sp.]
MKLYYNDEHIVAAYKPYGVLSEEDDKKPNMPALLNAQLGCEKIYTVHRLDRTTQGVTVYAKTREAASRLSELIQNGGMEKTYLAVIEGEPQEPAGEMRDLLYFDRKKNKSFVVRRQRRGVKEAILRYETLQTQEIGGMTLTLVRIRLLTGRTHQIRVQFASRRHPLAGDRRYGASAGGEIMLCASQLRFTHPFTGEELCFSYTPTDGYFGKYSIVIARGAKDKVEIAASEPCSSSQ